MQSTSAVHLLVDLIAGLFLFNVSGEVVAAKKSALQDSTLCFASQYNWDGPECVQTYAQKAVCTLICVWPTGGTSKEKNK